MSEISYSAAGVDIEAGDRAVELMKASIARATRPEVMGGIGGFAGLFDASKVVPENSARIVAGIADGCAIAGCALIGGETAEHPGLMAPDEFDIAGAATGVVDEPRLLGAHLVKEGDVLIAMASSGLHANGYSLVRHILTAHAIDLDATHPDLPASWGELLAAPTQIYAKPALALAALSGTHAMAHITGGGLAANTARSIPAGLEAVLDRATWELPPIFATLSQIAGLPQAEMEKTWNVGVGMVAAVDAGSLTESLDVLNGLGITSWAAGTVRRSREARASLVNNYRTH